MNRLVLTAKVVEISPMRYTPAGLPALDVVLEHESQIEEAALKRMVKATLKATALGELAQKLSNASTLEPVQFEGFLATPRNSKGVIFHLTHFQHIQR